MITLRSLSEIVKSIRADLSALLPTLDPTIWGSYIRALADSSAGRHFDNQQLVKQLEDELFPQTASGESAERWAAYEGLERFSASGSSGAMTATGTVGNTIPALTQLRSVAGNLYTTTADATISNVVQSVSSMTRTGSTVLVVFLSPHGFASNTDVTIVGANETEYNGVHTITVLSAASFTFEIATTPATPATGTITASCDCVTVNIESNGTGTEQNLDSGAMLTLTSPISGVDATSYAQYAGIVGAEDAETTDELISRTLQSRSNPVANFNPTVIEKVALGIQGVTRVKVKRITPDVGQVTVLFVRDNDDNLIPSAAEVTEVETAILEILPATSAEADVFVKAPTAVETNYTFTAISPDTTTMRAAITANIEAFYEDEATFETDITEDKYRSAIVGTIDPDTGDTLTSFTLSAPVGDITITTDEIGVPGDITF